MVVQWKCSAMPSKRYNIDFGKHRIRRSIRRLFAEAICAQYVDRVSVEGPRVLTSFNYQGTEFKINYTTRYLVSFITLPFLFFPSVNSICIEDTSNPIYLQEAIPPKTPCNMCFDEEGEKMLLP